MQTKIKIFGAENQVLATGPLDIESAPGGHRRVHGSIPIHESGRAWRYELVADGLGLIAGPVCGPGLAVLPDGVDENLILDLDDVNMRAGNHITVTFHIQTRRLH